MRKIKRYDTVLVLSGKDRGKQGMGRQVIPQHDRLVVEGINLSH
jgi:large subunit ribosomal protein L24